MIDPRSLSVDLRRQVRLLEDDLRGRVGRPGTDDAERLRAEYEQAVRAARTGSTWSAWRDERLTQIAVAWVLGTVFVRFSEDNDLLAASPKLAGPGGEAIVGAVDAQARYSAAEQGQPIEIGCCPPLKQSPRNQPGDFCSIVDTTRCTSS